ncbi:hypothetical protein ACRW9N_02450 [Listeria aquatica]|uniref:hypothetical protein n=1 Tax=Listeria aquatica TaxID=1494960 RepID=UPI003EFA75C5
MIENPIVINDPLLWQDDLTGFYDDGTKQDTEDGTMEHFDIQSTKESIYDHTSELRSFYLLLKKYEKYLSGSQLYDELLEAYEEAGEDIAKLKLEVNK